MSAVISKLAPEPRNQASEATQSIRFAPAMGSRLAQKALRTICDVSAVRTPAFGHARLRWAIGVFLPSPPSIRSSPMQTDGIVRPAAIPISKSGKAV